MSDPGSTTNVWAIGSVEVERVPYFDIGLPADSIHLGAATTVDWAEPWLQDAQPAVGQAFWLIRSDGISVVVDPCGASDDFLRSGADAVGHQEAAFAALAAAGHQPSDFDAVVLTHLDGIGMVALADGADAGSETWRAAFDCPVLVSAAEYAYIATDPSIPGATAFAQLDALGAIETVDPPHAIAPGVTLRPTGAHSPGHCVIDIESDGARAVLVGHLAVSPLHAAIGPCAGLHREPDDAWTEFSAVLRAAGEDEAVVFGSLWPTPGAAVVTAVDPFVLSPHPA